MSAPDPHSSRAGPPASLRERLEGLLADEVMFDEVIGKFSSHGSAPIISRQVDMGAIGQTIARLYLHRGRDQ